MAPNHKKLLLRIYCEEGLRVRRRSGHMLDWAYPDALDSQHKMASPRASIVAARLNETLFTSRTCHAMLDGTLMAA